MLLLLKNECNMINRNKEWLANDVFPLWLNEGVDWQRGGFIENLGPDGKARRKDARRTLVLCRQLYSLRVGFEMGVAPRERTLHAADMGVKALLRDFSGAGGSFVHSVSEDGVTVKSAPELYTQSFAIFGLAQAAQLLGTLEIYKAKALEIVAYLNRERELSGGGYFEIGAKGEHLYLSNPHMHLFEASLAWMEFDSDPIWRELADKILRLCLEHFIDPVTGFLAEDFDEHWNIIREQGRFIFEPGHQYEWSWLMGRYQRFTGSDLTHVRRNLFEQSEAWGIDPVRGIAWDQVWSNREPKLLSARFWPQAERVKSAVQSALDGVVPHEVGMAAADEAMGALWTYLERPLPGTWYDVREEGGQFQPAFAKASSLYHIIGAMQEYSQR